MKQIRRYSALGGCLILAVLILLMTGCGFLVFNKDKVQPFTFVQICDPQLGMGGYEHDIDTFTRAVEQINEMKPDLVVICGDLVEKPDDKSFADFKRIRSNLTLPVYCVPGNHDVGNKPDKAALARYRTVIGKDYYSFTHKGFTFVCSNTQLVKAAVEGESEKHSAWLEETLAGAKKKDSPVIVIGHYPLFITNPDEKEEYFNLPVDERRQLLTIFKECGVVAVLTGHVHKTLINEYEGILMVTGETTSVNFDKRPCGFRLWTVVSPTSIKHEFVPIEGLTEGTD